MRGRLPVSAAVTAALLAALGLGACASGPPPAIEVPESVPALRDAMPLVRERVERFEGPPEWATRADDEGRLVYGLGVVPADTAPRDPLYAVLREAEAAVVGTLEREGARVPPRRESGAPLPVPREDIAFERVGVDERSSTWYALARLDREEAVARAAAELAAAEARLAARWAELESAVAGGGTGVEAALGILAELDRRWQRREQLAALGGEVPEPAAGLDEATLGARAREVLAGHAVRVLVDGPEPTALTQVVRSELGAVHLAPPVDAAPRGWDGWEWEAGGGPSVSVLLHEEGGWSRRAPYYVVEGELQLALEGEAGRTRSWPVRAVGRGGSVEEARDRAADVARREVRELLRAALQPDASRR